jgi:hypothetical protein
MRTFKTEKDFQHWALGELKTLPHSWFYAPPTMARRGVPDILGCYMGRFVALELKLSHARRDPSREALQEYTIECIQNAGSPVAVARVTPENWQDVWKAIVAIPKGHGKSKH